MIQITKQELPKLIGKYIYVKELPLAYRLTTHYVMFIVSAEKEEKSVNSITLNYKLWKFNKEGKWIFKSNDTRCSIITFDSNLNYFLLDENEERFIKNELSLVELEEGNQKWDDFINDCRNVD